MPGIADLAACWSGYPFQAHCKSQTNKGAPSFSAYSAERVGGENARGENGRWPTHSRGSSKSHTSEGCPILLRSVRECGASRCTPVILRKRRLSQSEALPTKDP